MRGGAQLDAGALRVVQRPALPGAVGYGGPTGLAGSLAPGSEISLNATTACCTADYIRHQNGQAIISPISSSSSSLDKNDAAWIVRRGLASNSRVSFESRNYPGDYLRHSNFVLYRQPATGAPCSRRTPPSAR